MIEPKNNYILVEPVESQKVTAGGIYLPDRIDQEPRWYKVLSVGPGLPDMFGNIQKLDYRPGEYVYVFPHAVHKVNLRDYGSEYPDQEVTVLSEGDVLLKSDDPGKLVFQPVGAYCVVRLIKLPEPKTAGGIYLPDKSVPAPSLARVLAVGSGYRTAATGVYALLAELFDIPHRDRLRAAIKEYVPLNVRVGDTVLVVSTAPMKLNLEQFGVREEGLAIVGEADILCKLEVSDEAAVG